MYVCMYVHMYACMHACLPACLPACMHACMHAGTYVRIRRYSLVYNIPYVFKPEDARLLGGSWDLVSMVISTLTGVISSYKYSYLNYNPRY